MALLQIALVSGFMFAFRFPKSMIAFLAAFILLGTLVSTRIKAFGVSSPRKPVSPALQTPGGTVLGIAIGVCGFTLLSCALFTFVIFANSWSAWQRFKDQPYHATSFEVTNTYYQPASGKRSARATARGIVEGQIEWMDLLPYIKRAPRDEGELMELVPRGAVIHVYLFPTLKGQSRVQVIGPLPPAEANYKHAMQTLNRGLAILGILGGILVVLSRIRRSYAASGPVTATPATSLQTSN